MLFFERHAFKSNYRSGFSRGRKPLKLNLPYLNISQLLHRMAKPGNRTEYHNTASWALPLTARLLWRSNIKYLLNFKSGLFVRLNRVVSEGFPVLISCFTGLIADKITKFIWTLFFFFYEGLSWKAELADFSL